MEGLVRESPEVYYPESPDVVVVDGEIIGFLKQCAQANERQCCRLCLHPNVESPLHEMVIVHRKGAYVRPHSHTGKSESFHVMEGELAVVCFSAEGAVERVVRLSSSQERGGCCRISAGMYHTVIPMSEWVVFHETTQGPFVRGDCDFAPWAPDASDMERAGEYLGLLKKDCGLGD